MASQMRNTGLHCCNYSLALSLVTRRFNFSIRCSATFATIDSHPLGGERYEVVPSVRRAWRTVATEQPNALANSSWVTTSKRSSVAFRKLIDIHVSTTLDIPNSVPYTGYIIKWGASVVLVSGISAVNILTQDKQSAVIAALCEGVSLRSISRLLDVHRDTAMRLFSPSAFQTS
jgi:hypothetical protein